MTADQYPKNYLYRRVVLAKLFIDAHYADKIDVNNIAGEACFSKFHFIRLFRDIYGKTPHQYLTYVRLQKATTLLSNGVPVTEVCYLVGFESIGSFSSLFKRHRGLSPSAFSVSERLRRDRLSINPLSGVPACFANSHGWTKHSNSEELQ
jgi:AraC-like DNA-binding protein